MESKKAKFSVFLVVALLAVVCSTSLYSVTGGFSDWIVASAVNEDANNNGIIDSAENDNSIDYSSGDGSYKDDGGLFGWFYNSDSSSSNGYDYSSSGSSSSDEPDFLARIIRGIMNSGNSASASYELSDDSADYNIPVSDYDFSGISNTGDDGVSSYVDTINRGFDKFSRKVDSLFD